MMSEPQILKLVMGHNSVYVVNFQYQVYIAFLFTEETFPYRAIVSLFKAFDLFDKFTVFCAKPLFRSIGPSEKIEFLSLGQRCAGRTRPVSC